MIVIKWNVLGKIPLSGSHHNLNSFLEKLLYLLPAALAAGMLFSCTSNTIEEVLEFNKSGIEPLRTTLGVTYMFTDSGKVKNELQSGKVEQFQVADSLYSLLSLGFSLTFYTENQEVDGVLTAKNGFIKGDNSLMIARDSVVFVNNIGETLRTEELIWIQDSAQVFTDKFVTIEQADGVIYGKGMVSDQNFTNYRIKEVTGELYLKEENK